MPNSGLNFVFFGTEAFSLAALEAVVDAGYTVAAVVTKADRPYGRGMQLRAPVVKTYALERGITVLQPEKLGDIQDVLTAIPNRIGVLSSYGKIIPQSTLDLFEHGIINIHPSLLPKYRGPSPIETAIMNGDEQTGVSLMRLVAAMDAGPVFVQQTIELSTPQTASELYATAAQVGSKLLVASLPLILSGELEAVDQNESLATYTQLLNKEGSHVDPDHQTADIIERHIRAYEEYPRTRLNLNGHDVIITRAHVGSDGDLTVPCANDTQLAIDELIAPSGKKLSGSEFLRGYGTR